MQVTKSQWIVNPSYDLLFFSTAWLPPLLLFAAYGSTHIGLSYGFFFMWVYHLFIRMPHFMATYGVTYFQKEHWGYYKKHWVLYFLIPLAILTLYGSFNLIPGWKSAPIYELFLNLAYAWGYWHIAMQNYGILQVYQRRSEKSFDLSKLKIEKFIFLGIAFSIYLKDHFVVIVERVFSGTTMSFMIQLFDLSVFLALTALTGTYFYLISKKKLATLPGVLFFIVSFCVMVKWPFYESLPPYSWFMVFNGHHSIAYLGLLFMMKQNKKELPINLKDGVKKYSLYVIPLIGFSFIFVSISTWYNSNYGSIGYNDILVGFFVVHYYLESLVWRFKNEHNKKTTLPLLKRPVSSEAQEKLQTA